MDSKIVLTLVILSFLLVASIHSANATTATRTASTETTCTNGICTKTLYSGTRYVYENNKWITVEQAESLKDYYNVIYLEFDPSFNITVTDFNLYNLSMILNFEGNPLYYPEYCQTTDLYNAKCDFKLDEKWNEYNETTGEIIEKSQLKFQYKWEMKAGIVIKGDKVKFDYTGNPLDRKFKFGGNSTTIQLQTAETEHLEDIGMYHYGGSFENLTNNTIFTKFNLSSLPSGVQIDNATLNFLCYIKGNGWDGGVTYYRINNQTWTEDALVGDYEHMAISNTTTATSVWSSTGWDYLNVTKMVKYDYDIGNKNTSIKLTATTTISDLIDYKEAANGQGYYIGQHRNNFDPPNDNHAALYTKETTSGVADRPYINITYSNIGPTFNTNTTIPTSPDYASNAYISVNVTDPNNDLLEVNCTVQAPNNTLLIDNVNITLGSGDTWNSTTFDTNIEGSYNISCIARDNTDIRVQKTWNFSISLGQITATAPDSDNNHSYSATAGTNETINITITHNGNSNNTIDFRTTGDLSNTTIIEAIYYTEDPTIVENGETQYIDIILQSNASAPTGTYGGYIILNRTEDNDDNATIMFNFTLSNLAGNVNLINTTFSVAKTTDETQIRYFDINNDGQYNLTHCNFSLSSTLGVTITSTLNDFTVTNTTNQTATITFLNGISGTDNSASITLSCIATASGGTDTDSVTGSISITNPSAGGGGGGGTITINETIIIGDLPPTTEQFLDTPAYYIESFLLTPIVGPIPPLILFIFIPTVIFMFKKVKKQKYNLKPEDMVILLTIIAFVGLIMFNVKPETGQNFLNPQANIYTDAGDWFASIATPASVVAETPASPAEPLSIQQTIWMWLTNPIILGLIILGAIIYTDRLVKDHNLNQKIGKRLLKNHG